MRLRRQRGPALSLVLAAHPLPAVLVAGVLTAAAALMGRSGVECLLVAATALVGWSLLGWVDDLVDRGRDRAVGRRDKPVAMGWVDPGTVAFAAACAVLAVVPLSVANGTVAGLAFLAALLAALLGKVWFPRTVLSWLPAAVSFGLLPAFLAYGGLGGGLHGVPPTIAVTALAALLGIGVHVLERLPDLVEDKANGLLHLPLRIAMRIGAPRLLWAATAYTTLVGVGLVVAALTVGVRQ